MTASAIESARLPVWRLITGIAVLGSLVAVLVMLAPVYIDNYLLDQYMRALALQSSSVASSDAALAGDVLDRAKQLDLPVHASDIAITRVGGKPRIRIAKYGVQMNLVLYQVDLHFGEAVSR